MKNKKLRASDESPGAKQLFGNRVALVIGGIGDDDPYPRSAFLNRGNLEHPAAHHLEPLADVI